MKYKAKERIALISNKNMKKVVEYFNLKENNKDYDLTWAVNFLVDIAIGELKAIDKKFEEEERELQELLDDTEEEIKRLKE